MVTVAYVWFGAVRFVGVTYICITRSEVYIVHLNRAPCCVKAAPCIRRAPARKAQPCKRHVRPARNIEHPAVAIAEGPGRAQHRPCATADLHVRLPRDRDHPRESDVAHHVDVGITGDCARQGREGGHVRAQPAAALERRRYGRRLGDLECMAIGCC